MWFILLAAAASVSVPSFPEALQGHRHRRTARLLSILHSDAPDGGATQSVQSQPTMAETLGAAASGAAAQDHGSAAPPSSSGTQSHPGAKPMFVYPAAQVDGMAGNWGSVYNPNAAPFASQPISVPEPQRRAAESETSFGRFVLKAGQLLRAGLAMASGEIAAEAVEHRLQWSKSTNDILVLCGAVLVMTMLVTLLACIYSPGPCRRGLYPAVMQQYWD
mmetsp:Transcript_37249/g.89572  ORF Transcript_37249/g.89572 Transcript_37249/m.89572 type:complete len:219 (-) Transcript_37249:115-771(-)